ncbi:OmpA family protein, partial [Methylobacterium sp. WL9]
MEGASYLVARLGGFAPGAVASLSDTTLSIRGEALDPAAYAAGQDAPPQGFGLGAIEILPPRVDDFRFVVERRPDGGLTLGGNVVSEAARAEALKMAGIVLANTGMQAGVDDAMRTARGLDPAIDPAALTKAALRLAGLIREGSVRFERGNLSVSGTALDEEAVGEAEAALRDARPAGIGAGTVSLEVRPVSPYTTRIRRDSGSVTLSGYLPDRAARESLNAALRLRFLREAIVDRSRLSSGARPGLVAALTATLGPLSTLASGEIAVTGRTMQLGGESLYAESARRTGEDLRRAVPPGWESTVAVTTRDAAPAYDAPTCARLFSERLAGHTLRFAPGSSELKPDFYPVLDAVAELVKACRAERVEVIGHLDPPGAKPPKPETLPEAKAEKDKADKAKADKAKTSSKEKTTGNDKAPGKVAEAGKAADNTKADKAKPAPTPTEPPPCRLR